MIYSYPESGVQVSHALIAPTSVADLVDKICDSIDAQGCWTITGSSGDKKATSVENTSGGGFVARVRLNNGGSGNVVYGGLYDPYNANPIWETWTAAQGRPGLTYAASHQYRVLWSPYWFLVFDESNPTAEFLYCGVPKITPKPGETIAEAALLVGASSSSWRTAPVADFLHFAVNTNRGGYYRCICAPVLKVHMNFNNTVYNMLPYYADTPGTYKATPFEVVVDSGFGAGAYRSLGFLYDMALFYKSFARDVVEPWDGKNWQCVTHNCNPSIFVLRGPIS